MLSTSTLDGRTTLAWIRRFTTDFSRRREQLTELDRLAGDGDFGTNIASALRRAGGELPSADDAGYRSVLTATSTGFLGTGGTSGPLFGMWFRKVANAGSETATVSELATGVSTGLATVQSLGGARVGDNTMIDALDPASRALTAAADHGLPVREAFEAAASAARDGALSTADLIAHRGRASYVGELARGVLDPGAVTVALLFEAAAAAAGSARQWPVLEPGTPVR